MTANRLGIVGFAVLGVYLVVSAIQQVPIAVSFWAMGFGYELANNTWPTAVALTLSALTSLGVGLLLICHRERMSRWLIGPGDTDPAQKTDDLLAMAYAVLGVWLIVIGFSALCRNAWYFLSPDSMGIRVELITDAVTLALGALLFFKSRAIAGIWSRMQGGPTGKVTVVGSMGSTLARWGHAGRQPKGPGGTED